MNMSLPRRASKALSLHFPTTIRWWPDDDVDGEPVHVSEIDRDGVFHVVAGPLPVGRGWDMHTKGGLEDFVFSCAKIDPDGVYRVATAMVSCPAWKDFGRARRLAYMRKIVLNSQRIWGDSGDETLVVPLGRTLEMLFRETWELSHSWLPGRYGVREIGRFLETAMAKSGGIFETIHDAFPDEKVDRKLNAILAMTEYRRMLEPAFRRRPWFAVLLARTFSPVRVREILDRIPRREGCVIEFDIATISAILQFSAHDQPGWILTPRIVAWIDRWLAAHPGTRIPTIAAMTILDNLPASWLPRTLPEMDAFLKLAYMTLLLAPGDLEGCISLLRASKGRFVELVERMQADIGPHRELHTACHGARDFIGAACRDLLRMQSDTPLRPDGSRNRRIARRIISPDGGIRRFFELSDLWHTGLHAQQVQEASGRLETGDLSWPRAVEDFISTSGCRIVEILDDAALRAEGESQGHCAGIYARHCIAGGSHVFSIRHGEKTLSTFEAMFATMEGASLRIVQHEGPNRRVPEPLAVQALDEWRSAVTSGALPVSPRPRTEEHSFEDDPAPVMTLDQWRPFLAKPMGDLPEDEFFAAVEDLKAAALVGIGA